MNRKSLFFHMEIITMISAFVIIALSFQIYKTGDYFLGTSILISKIILLYVLIKGRKSYEEMERIEREIKEKIVEEAQAKKDFVQKYM